MFVVGDKFTLPELDDTATHTFEGWYEDEACTIPAKLNTLVSSTKNKTQLYAKWEKIGSNVEE